MNTRDRVRQSYRLALRLMVGLLGVRRAKVADAWLRFGRRLDLRDPSTLADKVSWLELNTDQTIPALLTDKFAVRDYVERRGLAHILVPICGGPWTSASDIDFGDLPASFAMKATHGCEMNIICRDKSALDRGWFYSTVNDWLSSDYSRACIEPHYKLVPHRVFCETYLDDVSEMVDYKFHCFDGVPQFILVCSERDRGLSLNLLDAEWRDLEGLQGKHKGKKRIQKPTNLEEMVDIASRLSSGFPFVRVDLYSIKDRVYFGEMTFSPAAGVFPYFTNEFVEIYGPMVQISQLSQFGSR